MDLQQDSNFISNLFNQIQMNVNFLKIIIYNDNFEKIDRDVFLEYINNNKSKTIDTFFYNLSIKDKDTLINKNYEKIIKDWKKYIDKIEKYMWDNGKIDEKGNYVEKFLVFKFIWDILYLFTPFAVKNNVWNFLEWFKIKLSKNVFKYNYIKTNGFKVTVYNSINNNDTFSLTDLKNIYNNTNDDVKIFYIDL